MATPLKTASRALSIATVIVAGFAAWLIATQDSQPPVSTATTPTPKRSVEFAAVTEPATGRRLKAVVSKISPRRRLDEGIARPVSKSVIDDDTLFDDEVAEPAHLSGSAKNRRSPVSQSPSRIQPELGRLSPRELDAGKSDDLDELNVPTADVVRQPSAPRRSTPPATVFRPVDVLPDAESARVESQLTSLQKKFDQLAQAQTEQKEKDLQKAFETLEQIAESKYNEKFEKFRQQLEESKQNGTDPTESLEPKVGKAKPDSPKPDAPPEPAEEESPAAKKPGAMRFEQAEGNRDRFDNIDFDDVDISKALAALGQLSGMNILVGRGVTGLVPAANLQNVTAEEALNAITKSLGYVYERDGNFVFVWTAADSLARKQAARKTVQKVFRPKYVSVKDLQTLITPMLTKLVGLIAVTTPTEMGLEESRTKVGGNSLAQTDALLVIDFPEVIAQIDMVVADIDVPPSQVMIEAMILSVKLEDSMKLGVNFALLNGNEKQLVTSGSGSQINSNVGFNKNSLIPVVGDFVASTAGLKYGFINGDLAGFVEALEKLAETSVVASPSVRVLNKQRAELIIGQRLGYKTTTFNGTQSIENINFLEVGTKLLLRPFVAQDGLVRMEIHPEKSTGIIADGLPQSTTTEVTSNVMVRDGSTIVIGGLIEEQANQTQTRIPGLGALPVIGNLFKNKDNATTRTELIVLITPRIIHDPEAECEGDLSRTENERRHRDYRDKLSPINRNSLAQIEYERAARYFEEGDAPRAKRHIDESLRHNRLDQDTLRLRDQIAAALDDKNWWKKLRRKPPTPYHNVPSAPTLLPGEAIFEQEIPGPAPTRTPSLSIPPAPPAPAATTDEPFEPPSSANRTNGSRTSRS